VQISSQRTEIQKDLYKEVKNLFCNISVTGLPGLILGKISLMTILSTVPLE
jgi:hypothetical protein